MERIDLRDYNEAVNPAMDTKDKDLDILDSHCCPRNPFQGNPEENLHELDRGAFVTLCLRY